MQWRHRIFCWLKCSSSKLFIWHLSKRIVRMESAGKGAAVYRKKPNRYWLKNKKKTMRECHKCTIFKLYTNSFCRQKVGLKFLMKVASKASRWKGERLRARIKILWSSQCLSTDRIFWKIKSDGRIRSKSLSISVVEDMHGPARSKRF